MTSASVDIRDVRHAARRALDLDRLFALRPSGYLGADGVISIPLGDGRTAWIFGDTLVGESQPGNRAFVAMPRNTVALQPQGSTDPDKVEFFFNDKSGEPASVFLKSLEPDRWFWGGTAVVLEGELFIFGYEVATGNSTLGDAMSFLPLTSVLLRVRDTSGSPLDWKVDVERVPCIPTHTWFNSANWVDAPWLYLLGIKVKSRHPNLKSSAVLARVRIDDLLERGALCDYMYCCENDGEKGWSRDIHKAVELYSPGVTESSIFYDAPRKRFIATTYKFRDQHFYVKTAPELTGPWSESALLFSDEECLPAEKFTYYTFRMHSHLAAHEDEMVFTYVVNTYQIEDLISNTGVYYPRFLRIDLTQI